MVWQAFAGNMHQQCFSAPRRDRSAELWCSGGLNTQQEDDDELKFAFAGTEEKAPNPVQ